MSTPWEYYPRNGTIEQVRYEVMEDNSVHKDEGETYDGFRIEDWIYFTTCRVELMMDRRKTWESISREYQVSLVPKASQTAWTSRKERQILDNL